MIKKLFNRLFFSKNLQEQISNDKEEKINQNNIEILITLTKDYEIDMLVYLKDSPQQPLTEIEYAMVCYEFINNSFSANIKKEIISIIERDIKTEKNAKLINTISILSNVQNLISEDELYIKPSQVFNYQK